MKTQLKVMLSAGAIAPLLLFGTAFATDNTTDTNDSSSGSATTTTQLTTAEKQDLEKRLQERENQFKLKLATNDQLRIKGKCKAAQGLLTSFNAKAKNIDNKRTETYSSLAARLATLSGKLQKQGVDVTTLNTEITTLKAKTTTFTTDFATYQQDITDLSQMDCASDPTGFQTSLQAARTAQETLRKDAQDIRTYVTQTIKPTLEKIRQALATSSSTSTTGGNQ